jgi:hypothetical protein
LKIIFVETFPEEAFYRLKKIEMRKRDSYILYVSLGMPYNALGGLFFCMTQATNEQRDNHYKRSNTVQILTGYILLNGGRLKKGK